MTQLKRGRKEGNQKTKGPAEAQEGRRKEMNFATSSYLRLR